MGNNDDFDRDDENRRRHKAEDDLAQQIAELRQDIRELFKLISELIGDGGANG